MSELLNTSLPSNSNSHRAAKTATLITGALSLVGLVGGPAYASPEVSVAVSVNDKTAGSAPGVAVDEGQEVLVRWTVAAGAVELYDLVVSEASGLIPDCDVNGDGVGDGTFVNPGPLAPGQSFECSAMTAAGSAGHTVNLVGQVRASDYDGDVVIHTDNAYFTTSGTPTTSAKEASTAQSTEAKLTSVATSDQPKPEAKTEDAKPTAAKPTASKTTVTKPTAAKTTPVKSAQATEATAAPEQLAHTGGRLTFGLFGALLVALGATLGLLTTRRIDLSPADAN